MRRMLAGVILLAAAPAAVATEPAEPAPPVEFQTTPAEIIMTVDGRAVGSYVFRDPSGKTPRPFFAHVKTPDGIQATRHHPPRPDLDRADHATMHPGIWMAFGDLDGADSWRNKASVVHARFLQEPRGGPGAGSFREEKLYLRPDKSIICREQFQFQLQTTDAGFLLLWDSTFQAETPFYFGDQEEMGLGIRVATPLSELRGGRLTDSHGRQGAAAIWSQAADWCDYSGTVDGKHVGMTLMCHPNNFRPSWMHARNYGFVAANPFGRQAMRKGPTSRVVVQPGEPLRLRFAVLVHSSAVDQRPNLGRAYADYVERTTAADEPRSGLGRGAKRNDASAAGEPIPAGNQGAHFGVGNGPR